MAKNNGRLRLFGANIVVATSDKPSDHDQKCDKFYTVDDDDEALKLSTLVSRGSDPPVYFPKPLRWFPPQAGVWVGGYTGNVVEISPTDHVDTTLSLSHASSRSSNEKGGKSGKRKRDDIGDEKKRRTVKRKRDNGGGDDQDSYPVPPLGLLQTIESRHGTKPVLLFQKKLEESDVSKHHNRLFITRREKQKLMKFLSDEEVTALNHSKQGLEIFAFDGEGKLYKLCFKIWKSLDMMVINSDWNKLVIGNKAQRGDWIQMWGYRENEKLRLAINFKKCEA